MRKSLRIPDRGTIRHFSRNYRGRILLPKMARHAKDVTCTEHNNTTVAKYFPPFFPFLCFPDPLTLLQSQHSSSSSPRKSLRKFCLCYTTLSLPVDAQIKTCLKLVGSKIINCTRILVEVIFTVTLYSVCTLTFANKCRRS